MAIFKVDSMDEAAKRLSIHRSELYRRIKSGEIHRRTFHENGKRVYLVYRDSSELSQYIVPPSQSLDNLGGGNMSTPYYQPQRKNIEHALLITEWEDWYTNGVAVKPWSDIYLYEQKRYIELYFSKFRLISEANLQEWITEVPKEKLSLRQNRYKAVSSFARFLCEGKGYMNCDEYEEIKRRFPKKPPGYQPTQRIIYQEQLSHILQSVDKIVGQSEYQKALLSTLVVLLGSTGLRRAEVCSLRVSKIQFNEDLSKATLTVIGKGNKERTLPFPAIAQTFVSNYLSLRPNVEEQIDGDNDVLFWVYNPSKKGYTTLKKRQLSGYIQKISEAVGIDFSTHSFRHCWITTQMNHQNNPSHVQHWAGHSDIRTTQRYTHIRDKDALESANSLGWEMFGIEKQESTQNPQQEISSIVDVLKEIANLPQEERELIAKMLGSRG